jgi:hypothetical protein
MLGVASPSADTRFGADGVGQIGPLKLLNIRLEPCRDAAVDTNCAPKGQTNYCTVCCTITHADG